MQFLRRSLLAGAFKFEDTATQVIPLAMLGQFRSSLNFTHTLICIGYGFSDIHINSILRKWLEFDAGRSFEIIAPGIRAIPPFITHLAPQVTLHNVTATAYLQRFSLKPLTTSELATKHVRAIVRTLQRYRKGYG